VIEIEMGRRFLEGRFGSTSGWPTTLVGGLSLYTEAFFVLYRKNGMESATQERAAITNIENASETRMTTPTPLLTS
jgi:hypothetical protein